MAKLTLKQFKVAFGVAWDWRRQRGPNDMDSAQQDRETLDAIERARSWSAVAEIAPHPWGMAAANRCLPEDV